jgi:hypothetical protein
VSRVIFKYGNNVGELFTEGIGLLDAEDFFASFVPERYSVSGIESKTASLIERKVVAANRNVSSSCLLLVISTQLPRQPVSPESELS